MTFLCIRFVLFDFRFSLHLGADAGSRVGIRNSSMGPPLFHICYRYEMNITIGLDVTVSCYIRPGTTWANKIKFWMNHAPGAGSMA